MELLFVILISLVIFGIIIFVHELGHFTAAKLVGIRVISFSLGFGPRLFSKKIGDTTFSFSAVPLGGYVIPAAGPNHGDPKKESPRLFKWLAPLSKEEQKLSEESSSATSGTMAHASFGAKLFFLINGLIFNILFAYGVYVFAFYNYGQLNDYSTKLLVGQFEDDSAAKLAGLKQGDLILSVNGQNVSNWDGWRAQVRSYPGDTFNLLVQRTTSQNIQEIQIQITPPKISFPNFEKSVPKFGFFPSIEKRAMSFTEAIQYATKGLVGAVTGFIQDSLGIKEPEKPKDAETFEFSTNWGLVSGFLDVGLYASQSLKHFLSMLVGISLVLVLFNAIPYPAFDGGQILVLCIEKVRGAPLPFALKEKIAYFGLGSSLLLALAALGNDLISTFSKMFN